MSFDAVMIMAPSAAQMYNAYTSGPSSDSRRKYSAVDSDTSANAPAIPIQENIVK